MPYRVELAPSAQRELRRLPQAARARLEPAILALADTPRPTGVRKLRGMAHTYRIRVGEYRIIYDLTDDRQLAVVLRIDRRSDQTYRNL